MAVHKEIYKKCSDVCLSMVAFRVQFKLEPHPHWSPLGRQNLRILMMSSWYFGWSWLLGTCKRDKWRIIKMSLTICIRISFHIPYTSRQCLVPVNIYTSPMEAIFPLNPALRKLLFRFTHSFNLTSLECSYRGILSRLQEMRRRLILHETGFPH